MKSKKDVIGGIVKSFHFVGLKIEVPIAVELFQKIILMVYLDVVKEIVSPRDQFNSLIA
jgi:hypothetical protein